MNLVIEVLNLYENMEFSGCIFLSPFFHEVEETNDKLMIITADHYIGESSRPDVVMHLR